MARLANAVALIIGVGVVAGCAPADPPPTTLRVTTEMVVCGGMIPPPGEPFCRPPTRTSRDVEVWQGRAVVASGTSGPDGVLVVEVPAGTLAVVAADQPPYLDCDVAVVTAVAQVETAVTQSCTLNAP